MVVVLSILAVAGIKTLHVIIVGSKVVAAISCHHPWATFIGATEVARTGAAMAIVVRRLRDPFQPQRLTFRTLPRTLFSAWILPFSPQGVRTGVKAIQAWIAVKLDFNCCRPALGAVPLSEGYGGLIDSFNQLCLTVPNNPSPTGHMHWMPRETRNATKDALERMVFKWANATPEDQSRFVYVIAPEKREKVTYDSAHSGQYALRDLEKKILNDPIPQPWESSQAKLWTGRAAITCNKQFWCAIAVDCVNYAKLPQLAARGTAVVGYTFNPGGMSPQSFLKTIHDVRLDDNGDAIFISMTDGSTAFVEKVWDLSTAAEYAVFGSSGNMVTGTIIVRRDPTARNRIIFGLFPKAVVPTTDVIAGAILHPEWNGQKIRRFKPTIVKTPNTKLVVFRTHPNTLIMTKLDGAGYKVAVDAGQFGVLQTAKKRGINITAVGASRALKSTKLTSDQAILVLELLDAPDFCVQLPARGLFEPPRLCYRFVERLLMHCPDVGPDLIGGMMRPLWDDEAAEYGRDIYLSREVLEEISSRIVAEEKLRLDVLLAGAFPAKALPGDAGTADSKAPPTTVPKDGDAAAATTRTPAPKEGPAGAAAAKVVNVPRGGGANATAGEPEQQLGGISPASMPGKRLFPQAKPQAPTEKPADWQARLAIAREQMEANEKHANQWRAEIAAKRPPADVADGPAPVEPEVPVLVPVDPGTLSEAGFRSLAHTLYAHQDKAAAAGKAKGNGKAKNKNKNNNKRK